MNQQVFDLLFYFFTIFLFLVHFFIFIKLFTVFLLVFIHLCFIDVLKIYCNLYRNGPEDHVDLVEKLQLTVKIANKVFGFQSVGTEIM